MNDLLFHAAPAAVRRLSQRLTELLDQLPSDERSKFLGILVVDEHERPRMVLTGQYSSGKSTLIKALTDEAAEVVIDSAVATDQVQDRSSTCATSPKTCGRHRNSWSSSPRAARSTPQKVCVRLRFEPRSAPLRIRCLGSSAMPRPTLTAYTRAIRFVLAAASRHQEWRR